METIPHIQESSIGTSYLTLDSIRSHTSQNAHNVSTSETLTSAILTEEASTISETTSVSNLLPHYTTTFQVPQPLARYPIYPTEQFQPPFLVDQVYSLLFHKLESVFIPLLVIYVYVHHLGNMLHHRSRQVVGD